MKRKSAVKSNPQLWKKIVSRVKKGSKGGKPDQWSARKAQLAVHKYKKAGGGYKGRKSRSNSLSKWTRQRWRTKSGRPSIVGKKSTGERYLPSKAIKSLSAREYRRTSRAKRRSIKKGKQYSRQPHSISRKIKKYRSSFGDSSRKEKLIKIIVSPHKNKKYRAVVKNKQTGRIRNIDFGDSNYEQYTDSTKLKKYKTKNHYNNKRRDNYFSRHSGTKSKREALKKEWYKSKGKYTPKILSHQYLW